jgi:hypothetical protein
MRSLMVRLTFGRGAQVLLEALAVMALIVGQLIGLVRLVQLFQGSPQT